MTTHTECVNRTCPNRQRLHDAAACYRAQQAMIAQLQAAIVHLRERLARYEQIGLRRWRQTPNEARTQALYGTQVWSENVLLQRALADLHAQMTHKNALLQTQRLLLAIQHRVIVSHDNAPARSRLLSAPEAVAL